jgi:hypothetical protein
MLSKNHFQNAIDAQSAVNLSGITQSLSNTMPHIWEEARAAGHGTEWVNKHPICRLYAEQICFLSGGGGTIDGDSYRVAYNQVEEILNQWGNDGDE